jgi:hypothetical protein
MEWYWWLVIIVIVLWVAGTALSFAVGDPLWQRPWTGFQGVTGKP